MSGAMVLKKRFSLPQSVIDHIFEGDKKGSEFSGFHSEAEHKVDDPVKPYAKFDGQLSAAMQLARDEGKPYQAMVKLAKGGDWTTAKLCTLFPNPHKAKGKKWTKDYIILKIEQALTDPADSVRHSRAAWESQKRGIRTTGIQGAQDLVRIRVAGISCHVQYTDGVITSVYPATFG